MVDVIRDKVDGIELSWELGIRVLVIDLKKKNMFAFSECTTDIAYWHDEIVCMYIDINTIYVLKSYWFSHCLPSFTYW